jgi:peptidoglycan-associated lipoprotein
MSATRSYLWNTLFLTLPGLLFGCAHAQHQETSAASPPPQVSAPAQRQEAARAPEVAPKKDDVEELLAGNVIHFDFNTYHLTSDSQHRLQRVAEVLRTHPAVAIRVSGNCDDRGTEEYNLALGQQRAQVARKYLVDLGIAPRRIDAVSYGEERPIDNRETEEAWATNRRDEFALARSE